MKNEYINATIAKEQYIAPWVYELERILNHIQRISTTNKFYTKKGVLDYKIINILEERGFIVEVIGSSENKVTKINWGWQ